MPQIDHRINAARFRLWINRYLRCLATCLAWAALAWLVVVLAERLLALEMPLLYAAGLAVGLAVLAAAIWVILTAEDRLTAALALDRAAALKERLSTALYVASSPDPFAQAAVADAERTASMLQVRNYVPLRYPRRAHLATATWLAALLVAWLFPAADLLGRRQTGRKQQLAKQKSEQLAKKVTPLIKKVKKRAARNPALKKQLKALDDVEAQLAKLTKPPDRFAVQTVKKLTSLAEQVRKQQLPGLQRRSDAMRASLSKLGALDASGVVQRLAKALAAGNYQQATRLLRQIQSQVQQAAKDPQKAAVLAGQLQALAEALKNQSLSPKLAEQLKAAGLSPQQIQALKNKIASGTPLSEAELQQLRQTMLKNGLTPAQANALLQKLAAACQGAAMAGKLGSCLGNAAAALKAACQGQGQGRGKRGQGKSGNALKACKSSLGAAEAQLSEMQALEAELANMQALLADLQAACSAVGMGSGGGSGGGMGGPGRGRGGVAPEQQTPHALKPTKSPTPWTKGAIIAEFFIDGKQIKGESKKEFADAVSAAERDAAKTIDERKLPPQYDEPIRNYFKSLREIGRPEEK